MARSKKANAKKGGAQKGGVKKGGVKSPAKAKMTKSSTMMATAKEAVAYLYPSKNKGRQWAYLQDDAKEALASKGIKVPEETSPGKKAAGKASKPSMKRDSTMAKTVAEAKQLLDGKVTVAKGRKARTPKKTSPTKPALKRAGTMQNTAKEGQSYLNRGKGKKGKGRK